MTTLLILEDGDEYLRFFSRHLAHFNYLQAHNLTEAQHHLTEHGDAIDAFILDLRFDRIPREDLIGDAEDIAEEMFGGPEEIDSAWRYIIDHQGYLILRALRDQGRMQPALLIAELPERQHENLRRLYGAIGVVPSFEPKAIAQQLQDLLHSPLT